MLQIFATDRNHEFYAIGVIGCMLTGYDLLRAMEELIDRYCLARGRRIGKKKLVELV